MNGPALAADVVVLAGDPPASVLLVQRRNEPFEGDWALPGGFVEADERVATGAARELREETGVEAGALRLLGVYDTPGRDPRGPVVSVVFVMRAGEELEATAADDAADARWFPLGQLPELAFDHSLVIDDAISFAAPARRS